MKVSLIVLVLAIFCTGCWDMKEINTLAIVTLIGVDKQPKSGTITAYYQIVNPMGLSTGSAPAKASVYTYHFKNNSLGGFTDKTTKVMPRKFFTAHIQSYIISERYARQGILDFINFIEFNPERRSNVILFISASPMYSMLESYTPMDKVPGRFIRSLANQFKPNFSRNIYPLRFKDFENELHHHTPTVIPIIHYSGKQPATSTERLETMDASDEGISLNGGAVFVHARMEGKLDESSKLLFYVLNKKYKKRFETLTVKGADVDVEGENIHVKRKWNSPRSQLTIDISAELRLLNNQQNIKLTDNDLHAIEQAFNEKLSKEVTALHESGKAKGWDLIGIQDNGGNEQSWRQTKVTVHVHSTLTTIGNTNESYYVE